MRSHATQMLHILWGLCAKVNSAALITGVPVLPSVLTKSESVSSPALLLC